MALNRQSTQTITFDAYLWNKGVYDGTESDIKTTDWWLDLFSKNIIEAHSDMNKKFCLMVRTPFKDMSGLESDGLNKNGTNIVKIGATGVRYVTRKYKKISWMVDMNDSNTLYEGGVIGAKYGIITSNTFDITKVKAFNGDSFENSIVCVFDDWFILTNVTYNQSWGDISSWSLTFTSALEEEK